MHPTQDLMALGLVDGRALLYLYQGKGETCTLHTDLGAHKEACRAVLFEPTTGARVYTASSDKSIRAIDVATGKVGWEVTDAHDEAVNCLTFWEEGGLLVSGDDIGGVKLWDCREGRKKAVASIQKHEDFIADLLVHDGMLFGASGDNTLSTYDLKQRKLVARTMDQEDELLSLSVLKHGKKVVAGTQSGVLLVYSWGEWLNCTDRFVGHPETVEALVKVDEETLLTGSSDGLIRLCSVLPNKLLGVLGSHEDFPVERMKMGWDRRVLASIAHDSVVRFWDMSILEDDNEEEEEEEEGEEEEEEEEEVSEVKSGGRKKGAAAVAAAMAKKEKEEKEGGAGGSSSSSSSGSDDEDEEEDEEDKEEGEEGEEDKEEDEGEEWGDDDAGGDSDRSSGSEEEQEPKRKGGQQQGNKKLRMTPAESFFKDL